MINIKPAKKLLILHIFAYSSLIPMIMYADMFEWCIAIAIYYTMSAVGISVCFHRLLTHRSFETSKVIEYAMTAIGSLGMSGPPASWVIVHRAHHKYSDTPKDPHSPHHMPFWKMHFLAMFSEVDARIPFSLLRSKFHRILHRHYYNFHFFILICLLAIDPFSAVYLYLTPAALSFTSLSLINTINHKWGYRNFNTKDKSVCNPIASVLAGGEGWHNNHHANPRSPNFGVKWYEFDLGYQIIKLIRK